MIEPDKLYTVDELADLLHLHPQTIYKKLRTGEIKRAPVKTGRRVLIYGCEVLEDRPAADGQGEAPQQ